MPRVTKEQMKRDEEKVIKILSTKANESIDSIAKQCGFSRQKAWRIIKNLEKNKTIWGYHAVADMEKLNLKTFYMLIKATPEPAEEAAKKLISREVGTLADKMGVTVECSSYLHGGFDWIIVFYGKDLKQAKRFEQILYKTYPNFLETTVLLEELFPLKHCGFYHPQIDKIKEFL